MFLGTNLTYCISDILSGEIEYSDVFCIVTTEMCDLKDKEEIEDWYVRNLHRGASQSTYNRLAEFSAKETLDLYNELVYNGTIINKPYAVAFNDRSLGMKRGAPHWYSLCVTPDDMIPAVKEAWNYYKMIEKLTK